MGQFPVRIPALESGAGRFSVRVPSLEWGACLFSVRVHAISSGGSVFGTCPRPRKRSWSVSIRAPALESDGGHLRLSLSFSPWRGVMAFAVPGPALESEGRYFRSSAPS